MERHIVHLDLDAFFVSVEIKKNSALKGIPLAVGGTGDRAIVAACSYEARRFGVHSAMPMKLALRLCPHLKVIRGDMESYSQHSRLVTEIIASKVPRYEKASIDEFYVDLTGMDRYFGCSLYSAELKQFIIKESGLPISYALASNKLLSKVATNEVKPNGQLEVPFGSEKSYLSPLSVKKLPGIGDKTSTLLSKMGVEYIRTLAEVPLPYMQNMFGKSGTDLSKKANGIDESPVVPYSEAKSISTENTFEQDTIDMQFLNGQLVRMVEKIGFELRNSGYLTGCVTVKLRYANFDTHTQQRSIPYTAADHVLLKIVKELFAKLYERRMLVRLIGVRFSHLVQGTQQINLFEDTQEIISLYNAIDAMKKRFGSDKITRAVTLINC